MKISPLHERASPLKGDLASFFKLINSNDPASLQQAVELILQIQEPFDALFDQCGVDDAGQLLRSKHLSGSTSTQAVLDTLLTYQLSIAPSGSRGEEIRKNITKLQLELTSPVKIEGFDALDQLEIRLAPDFKSSNLEWLGDLPALSTLNIGYRRPITKERLPSFLSLTGLRASNLTKLNLSAPTLRDVSALKSCTKLTRIDFIECPELQKLDSMSTLLSLEELYLTECSTLSDLSPLDGLKSLRILSIQKCNAVCSLAFAGTLPSLEKLQLSWNTGLTYLDFGAEMPRLLELEIRGDSPTSLKGLELAPNLSKLSLTRHKIASLEPLIRCSALNTLTLVWSEKLNDFEPLRSLKSLKTFKLNLQYSLPTDISPLSDLSALTHLDIEGPLKGKTVSYEPIANLTSLTQLTLTNASGMTNSTFFIPLSMLERLEIARCKDFVDLTGLENHPTLKSIVLNGCENIKDITPLATIKSLKFLSMYEVKRPKGLKELKSNKDLEIQIIT